MRVLRATTAAALTGAASTAVFFVSALVVDKDGVKSLGDDPKHANKKAIDSALESLVR